MGPVLAYPQVMLASRHDADRLTGAVSPVSAWATVVEAGGVLQADNGGSRVTTLVQIAKETTRPLIVAGAGTNVLLRVAYPTGLANVTAPVVQVFGLDPNGVPMLLVNSSGDDEITLPVDETNIEHDGLKRGKVDVTTTALDMLGCNTIIVAIKTALTAEGDASEAIIEAKVV